MKRFLLINPWIYDFAAYDYGIKPLGLLRIAEYLRKTGNYVHLVDCMDGCSKQKDEYGFSKIKKEKIDKPNTLKNIQRPYFRYGISINEFLIKIENIKDIDAIYITSGMTYWYPGVFLAIKLLNEKFKNIPITLGGIYATLCHRHARLNSRADIVCKGDFLEKNSFLHNGFYPAYDLLKDKDILPIQLTRGCPFRCTYCASRIMNPRLELKDPVNLFEEVNYYNKAFGTNTFVFYDDALTFYSDIGIKKFLRMVAASGKDFSFHTPNGIHARYLDEELAELFRRSNFKEIRLALETADDNLQEFTGGKVNNNDIKRAVRNLREAGFAKNDIGIYILIGASWLNIEKTLNDILFVNSLGAKAILASYSPIPGTKDYKMLIKNKILSPNIDPLWHNKTIFPELLSPNYSNDIQKIRKFTSVLNRC